MPMYAVITGTSRPAVDAAIPRLYPKNFKWGEAAWFISTTDSAKTIADQLFTQTDVKKGVIVFRVTASYYGYSSSDFWDWVAQTFKEEADG